MSWWKIPMPKRYKVECSDCATKEGAADYDRMSAMIGLRKSLRRLNIVLQQHEGSDDHSSTVPSSHH